MKIWALRLPCRMQAFTQIVHRGEPALNKAASPCHHPYCHHCYYHLENSPFSKRAPKVQKLVLPVSRHLSSRPICLHCSVRVRRLRTDGWGGGFTLDSWGWQTLENTHLVWGVCWLKESRVICKPEAHGEITWSPCRGRTAFPFSQG